MRDLADIISSHGGSPSRTWAGSDAGDRRRMFEFRHCVPKSIFDYVAGLKEEMPAINKMGTDMSVPREQSPGMMSFYREKLEESGLEYVIFGHMGNFHPHVEIILKDMADLEKAREVYDVFAAEAVRVHRRRFQSAPPAGWSGHRRRQMRGLRRRCGRRCHSPGGRNRRGGPAGGRPGSWRAHSTAGRWR